MSFEAEIYHSHQTSRNCTKSENKEREIKSSDEFQDLGKQNACYQKYI